MSEVKNLLFDIKGFTRFVADIHAVKGISPRQVIDIVLIDMMYNDINVLYRFVYADIPASCYTKLLRFIKMHYVNEKYEAEVMICGQLSSNRLCFILELTEQQEGIHSRNPVAMVWRVTDIIVL